MCLNRSEIDCIFVDLHVVRIPSLTFFLNTVLKYLIQNDPNVLQVTFNCGDEGCQSECGSCWVTYENRLPSLPDL